MPPSQARVSRAERKTKVLTPHTHLNYLDTIRSHYFSFSCTAFQPHFFYFAPDLTRQCSIEHPISPMSSICCLASYTELKASSFDSFLEVLHVTNRMTLHFSHHDSSTFFASPNHSPGWAKLLFLSWRNLPLYSS